MQTTFFAVVCPFHLLLFDYLASATAAVPLSLFVCPSFPLLFVPQMTPVHHWESYRRLGLLLLQYGKLLVLKLLCNVYICIRKQRSVLQQAAVNKQTRSLMSGRKGIRADRVSASAMSSLSLIEQIEPDNNGMACAVAFGAASTRQLRRPKWTARPWPLRGVRRCSAGQLQPGVSGATDLPLLNNTAV